VAFNSAINLGCVYPGDHASQKRGFRQRSCPWCFRGKRMEGRDPREVTLQREEIDMATRARTEKGHKKGH
jgi:hypothetical protein